MIVYVHVRVVSDQVTVMLEAHIFIVTHDSASSHTMPIVITSHTLAFVVFALFELICA